MQDIESIALQTYQDNMLFFEQKHPTLHTKLLALDTILNDGSYPQKYDLEYKDNYFDVIDLNSNNYLYKQNSEDISQKFCDDINYKKNEHTFKSYRKTKFEEKTKEFLRTQDAYTNYATSAEIMDYYYNNSDDTMSMNDIKKFIFLGSGLGMHIQKIVERLKLDIVLIIENDIELFRLSLFTTNYKETLKTTKTFFCVAENQTEFHNSFNEFFTAAFFYNQYIKFHVFSSDYETKIQEIRSLLITRPETTYSHERLLLKNKKIIDKIVNGYKYIDLRKKENETFFHDKPWLVLGAGPSLNKNTQWIIDNQDKFIIIAAFTALNTLKRIGVSPDIAVQIDENVSTSSEMIEKLGDLSFLDNSMIFFSGSVSTLLFEKFKKEQIYLHEDRTKYKLQHSTLIVTSVGETIYSLALIFNASKIYTLGIDLALGDDKKTHSPDHFKVKSFDENNTNDDDFQLTNNIMTIKGNLRDTVETLPIFAFSIPIVNFKTAQYKSDNQQIFNLSDGAYFQNIIPTKVSDVKFTNEFNKKNMYPILKDFFDKYSTKQLQDDERELLTPRQEQISDYYNYIEVFKSSPQANQDIFFKSFVSFVTSIINHQTKLELQELLMIYFLRVASYVDDLLYTKEVSNKKKHMKKLKGFFIKQVEKMVSTYEKDLQRLLKEL